VKLGVQFLNRPNPDQKRHVKRDLEPVSWERLQNLTPFDLVDKPVAALCGGLAFAPLCKRRERREQSGDWRE
jgi:hypothetical protein